ncbi:competence protein ComEC [Streptosporangium carneum]|uniref:Competence protein ComEC n=1 Tax=Streptosporangium carneum TaxID=47481 RepID=A0A9W6I202_9ACTN|nr:competence protein ComEC [Streptosporangium carneum]
MAAIAVGGALLAAVMFRREREAGWRSVTFAVLVCVAAVAGTVAFHVRATGVGPVAELVGRRASATVEAVVTDDPRELPQRGGLFRRKSFVVSARIEVVETAAATAAGGSTGTAGNGVVGNSAVENGATAGEAADEMEKGGESGGSTGTGVGEGEGEVMRGEASGEARGKARGKARGALGRVAVRASVTLLASGEEWRSLLPSQRIAVRGRFGPAGPGELLAAVVLVRGPPQVLSGPSWIQRVAGELRSGLREAAAVLPPAQRGLLPALVVGDVSRMDEQVRADFKQAGLSHLTAVSGANLAVTAGAAVALARSVGLPLAARAALAMLAMFSFAIVARPSPSVLRALLMGSVGALALGTGRPRDGVAALSVTVLGLILFDPVLARSYGFALSVCATGGILVLAPRWRDRFATRLPRWVAEAIAVPAAAQVAVTPVLVLMSGQLVPAAVPANLLAGPAVAPATLLGFVAALVAPLHMGAAHLLVRPAGLAIGWIIEVAEHAAVLPLGVISWPGGLAGLIALLVVVPLAFLALRRQWSRRVVAAAVSGAAVVAVVAGSVVTAWPPEDWLLVACDVGQGDALLVAAGPGRAVVVDTGPDPVRMDRCLRSMRVREVPLVILTHPHFDHVGGLDGVFRRRTVGAIMVTPRSAAESEGVRLSGDLARRRVVEWAARPGLSWRLGPSELTVLAPQAETPPSGGGEGTTINNASVVVHVRWAAGTALLSGDIETEAQTELLRRGLPRVDILKVPHHGSARHDPAFFAATGARAALISVGADNDYGHPAAPTLTGLLGLGMRVYRTDLSGTLAVVAREGGLAVVSGK